MHQRTKRARRTPRVGLAVGLAMAALVALAAPASAAPAEVPQADWAVSLDATPGRNQRVGQPFSVSFLPLVHGADQIPAAATVTYVVPGAFRILTASGEVGGGGGGPACDVTGQTITCPIETYSAPYGQSVKVRLLPLASGQNISSTITVVGDGSGEPDPDPHANAVSFLTDVTPSLVDVSANVYSFEPEVAVGEPVTYYADISSHAAASPLSVAASLELPTGFAVSSASWALVVTDQYGQEDLEWETGACAAATPLVTCDVGWWTSTQTDFSQGYTGQITTERIAITVVGTHTAPGPDLVTTVSVAATSPYQAEVNPDPHPNTDSTSVDVVSSDSPSSVSGTVTGPMGSPVDGATVLAYAPTDGFLPSGMTTTGADGTYTFAALTPGSYALAYVSPEGAGFPIQWAGNSSTRSEATLVTIDGSGQPVAGIDEQFSAAASVAGTVRGPSGDPVAGVTVRAFNPGVNWVPAASAVTGPDGTYSFPQLASGPYEILFQPLASTNLLAQWYWGQPTRATVDTVVVIAGAAVVGIDADLAANGGGAGRVAPLGR